MRLQRGQYQSFSRRTKGGPSFPPLGHMGSRPSSTWPFTLRRSLQVLMRRGSSYRRADVLHSKRTVLVPLASARTPKSTRNPPMGEGTWRPLQWRRSAFITSESWDTPKPILPRSFFGTTFDRPAAFLATVRFLGAVLVFGVTAFSRLPPDSLLLLLISDSFRRGKPSLHGDCRRPHTPRNARRTRWQRPHTPRSCSRRSSSR